MLVSTAKGRFSAVEHRHDRRLVLVRSRTREGIEALGADLGVHAIEVVDDGDYRFRMVVWKTAWAGWLAGVALALDYAKLEDALAEAPES